MEPSNPQMETLETISPSKPSLLSRLDAFTQQNLTNTAASEFNQALGLVGQAHHPSYFGDAGRTDSSRITWATDSSQPGELSKILSKEKNLRIRLGGRGLA